MWAGRCPATIKVENNIVSLQEVAELNVLKKIPKGERTAGQLARLFVLDKLPLAEFPHRLHFEASGEKSKLLCKIFSQATPAVVCVTFVLISELSPMSAILRHQLVSFALALRCKLTLCEFLHSPDDPRTSFSRRPCEAVGPAHVRD